MFIVSEKLKQFLSDYADYDAVIKYLNNLFNSPLSFDMWSLNKKSNLLIDYFDIRNGELTYLPAGKEHIVEKDGSWSTKNRQSCSPSKFLSKITMCSFNDFQIESFTNAVHTTSNDFTFELLDNNHIHDIYQICSEHGTLGKSCMNGVDYFEIYTRNKNLKILCLYKDETLVGRALVWYTPDLIVMDRIYTAATIYEELFKNYARTNDWAYKAEQNHACDYIILNNKELPLKLEIDLGFRGDRLDSYPYVDTFYYLTENILSNISGDIELREIDGNSSRRICDCCEKVTTSLNEPNNGLYRNEELCDDCIVYCENDISVSIDDDIVRVNRDIYWVEDEEILELKNGDYALRDEVVEIDGEYYHEDDCTFDEIDEYHILESHAITLSNGYITHRDNAIVLTCGTTIYKEDAVTLNNGDVVHRENVMVLNNGDIAHKENVEFVNGKYTLKIEI